MNKKFARSEAPWETLLLVVTLGILNNFLECVWMRLQNRSKRKVKPTSHRLEHSKQYFRYYGCFGSQKNVKPKELLGNIPKYSSPTARFIKWLVYALRKAGSSVRIPSIQSFDSRFCFCNQAICGPISLLQHRMMTSQRIWCVQPVDYLNVFLPYRR